MSLPGITAPAGTPVFLAAGHNVQERGVYETVEFGTGHSRTRPVRTKLERVVAVSWLLEEDEAAAVDHWLEETLKSASLHFSAQVASQDGDGLLWWRARWQWMPTFENLNLGRKRMSGQLFLVDEGSVEGPDTSTMAVEFVQRLTAASLSIAAGAEMAVEFRSALVKIESLRVEFGSALTKRLAGEERETEDGQQRMTEGGQVRETEA